MERQKVFRRHIRLKQVGLAGEADRIRLLRSAATLFRLAIRKSRSEISRSEVTDSNLCDRPDE